MSTDTLFVIAWVTVLTLSGATVIYMLVRSSRQPPFPVRWRRDADRVATEVWAEREELRQMGVPPATVDKWRQDDIELAEAIAAFGKAVGMTIEEAAETIKRNVRAMSGWRP